jgi:heme oxygenase
MLPRTPSFYVHDAAVTADRRAFIEQLYASMNEAGEAARLDEAATARLVSEAEAAFALNAELYREAAPQGTGLAGLFGLALVGGARMAAGLAAEAVTRR